MEGGESYQRLVYVNYFVVRHVEIVLWLSERSC